MNNLRKIRQTKHLTQTDVAKAIGISYQSLGLYENEKCKPDPDTLCSLANYFGVTVDYILNREPESGLIYVHKDPELTDDKRKVLKLYDELSPERKREAIVWLKTMRNLDAEQQSDIDTPNRLG